MPKKSKNRRQRNPVSFDKYDLYRRAVQSAETDVEFIRDTYKQLKKKSARHLREDFCGTFALSTEWVKLGPQNTALGVDLDPEPMEYGREHYFSKLKPEQQARLKFVEGNVLDPHEGKSEIVLAMNFSYFCFKSRELIKSYFANVCRGLTDDGILIADCFGGKQCQAPIEDTKKMDGFTYYWDQESFDPITNEAQFYIHFRVGGQKVEKVFSYDWRMWTIPELREIMSEAGFKKTNVYWEGTAKDGSGNGVFTLAKEGEACDSWIAYIVAEK